MEKSSINSKKEKGQLINMNKEVISKISQIDDEKAYRVADLQSVLKNLGYNYSIYTIRDYETYKCLNYTCGKRHNDKVDKCSKCGGSVHAPRISSPRTLGGGKGVGHRRYLGKVLKEIIDVFKQTV